MNNFIAINMVKMYLRSNTFRFFKDDIHRTIYPIFCKSGCSTIGMQICRDNNIQIGVDKFWNTTHAQQIIKTLKKEELTPYLDTHNTDTITYVLREPHELIVSKINWLHHASMNGNIIYTDTVKRANYIDDIVEYIDYNIQNYSNGNNYDPHAIPNSVIIDRYLNDLPNTVVFENLAEKRFDRIYNETDPNRKLIQSWSDLTQEQQTTLETYFQDDILLWNRLFNVQQ